MPVTLRAIARTLLLGTTLPLVAGMLAGCSDDAPLDRLVYSDVRQPPVRATLGPRRLELIEGTAVAARLQALDREGEELDGLRLYSDEVGILSVSRSAGHHIFVAHAAGETTLAVHDDDGPRGVVSVVVVAQ